jgi:hypothetical protein
MIHSGRNMEFFRFYDYKSAIINARTNNMKTRQVSTYNVTLSRVRATYSCSGKAVSIAYSDRVSVALRIHNAKRMRRIISPSAASPSLQYFFILSHKRHDFRGCGGEVYCI